MRRPPTPPRRIAAALAAFALLAACAPGADVAECPGVEVGNFRLLATRTAAACAGDTAPGDGSAICLAATPSQVVDCATARPVPACCFDRLFPAAPEVTVTIAYGSQGSSAALCPARPLASPFLGTRTPVTGGETLAVELDSAGAVLAACASACAVTVHHAITGTVARDPLSGAATGFAGELVETASATPSADCTPCAAPCAATWALVSAP